MLVLRSKRLGVTGHCDTRPPVPIHSDTGESATNAGFAGWRAAIRRNLSVQLVYVCISIFRSHCEIRLNSGQRVLVYDLTSKPRAVRR